MPGIKPKNYTKEVHLRISEDMNESIKSVAIQEECGRPEAIRKLLRYGIERFYQIKKIERETLGKTEKGGTESETQAG